MKKLKLSELHNEEEEVKLKELMEIHGGMDEDEDEDCYFLECLLFKSINICVVRMQ